MAQLPRSSGLRVRRLLWVTRGQRRENLQGRKPEARNCIRGEDSNLRDPTGPLLPLSLGLPCVLQGGSALVLC